MSDSSNNRSTEVVSACMEKCLKVLPAEQRDLLLKYYGNENQLRPDLALSILQLKTGTPELRECLRKCLEESDENSLPV